jgi:hypothetical protein
MWRVRLNEWQRMGIVLSVVWAIVGGVYGMGLGRDVVWRQYQTCLAFAYQGRSDEGGICETFNEQLAEVRASRWYKAATVGLVPIPVAWLVVYVAVGLVRWVSAGFKTT